MVKCGVPTITKSAISQLENYNFTLPVRHLDWTHNLGKHPTPILVV